MQDRELIDALKIVLEDKGYITQIYEEDKFGNPTYDLTGLFGVHIVGDKPIAKAKNYAMFNRMPAVFKNDGEDWTVTMTLDDWLQMHKAYEYKENLVGVD